MRGDRLLEAREQLRICAGPTCKDWMIKECGEKLTAIEARIPSVVFDVSDDGGNALVDVTVATGERVLMRRNDGRAVELNPGAYPFVFTLPDGRRAEKTVVVPEGAKSRAVSVVFPRPVSPAPLPVAVPPPSLPTLEPHRSGSWFFSVVGFSVAGAGIIAGTITGVVSLNKVSTLESECGADKVCPSLSFKSIADDAKTFGTISTIGFIAAGAGLVLGVLTLPNGPVTIGIGPRSAFAMGAF